MPPAGTNGTVVVPDVGGGENQGQVASLSAWADDGTRVDGEIVDGSIVFRVEGGREYSIR